MTNFIIAVVIGGVIGLIAGLAVRGKQPNAIWLAPVAGVVGAVLASILAALFGQDPAFGWKEGAVQVVLALVGAGAVAFMATKKGAGSSA
ncbi:MAG: GlsB/YeaQ/YmgE family stress response membrane protein [Micromonosporaceae bacterium]